MIESILTSIQEHFSNLWDSIFNPIYVWYFWGGVAFIAAIVIGYFAPFKWVRAGLGVGLLLIGSYIAGGKHMQNNMREKIDDAKRKTKDLAKAPEEHWPSWF